MCGDRSNRTDPAIPLSTSSTLVVTDLDGTLWDTSLTCHPGTLAALAEVVERDDVELLVATGRRRNSAGRGLAQNGIVLPAVLLNGALGFDFATESVFHEVNFDAALLQGVLEGLQRFGLGPVAYLSDTRVLVVEGVTTSLQHIDSLGQDIFWSSFADLAPRSDVLGMSMLGIDEALIMSAVGELEALAGVQVAAYADHLYPPFSLMLAPADVTKEVGIRAYCEHRGLTPDRVIALGDGGNDLEMLAMADVALVVEDADPRALALADRVIERPVDGGWAAVLDHL